MRTPPAPRSLSKDAAGLWKKLLDELGEWEDSQLLILRTGLEQWDVMQRARVQLESEGLTTPDRFGQMKVNPLASVMRDAASGVRAMYKILGLDYIEAP